MTVATSVLKLGRKLAITQPWGRVIQVTYSSSGLCASGGVNRWLGGADARSDDILPEAQSLRSADARWSNGQVRT